MKMNDYLLLKHGERALIGCWFINEYLWKAYLLYVRQMSFVVNIFILKLIEISSNLQAPLIKLFTQYTFLSSL